MMRNRTWCGLILAALAIAVSMAAPAASRAGTYEVSQCRLPDGTPTNSSDVVGAYNAAYAYWDLACATAVPHMAVAFETTVSHPFGATSTLTYSAPPNTSITGVSGNRVIDVGAGGAFRSPIARIETASAELESCIAIYGCTARGSGSGVVPSNAFAFNGFDTQAIRFRVLCDGGADCTPENPKARLWVYRAEFTMKDAQDPVPKNVTGALVAPGVKNGTLSVSYNASDAGSGVYRTLLKIDGTVVDIAGADANGGDCVDAVPGGDPHDFTRAVPCKLNAAITAALNTATVADGTHQLSVEVEDAAGNRSVVFAPTSFVFDNQPPAAGGVSVAGTVRVGQTLTATAAGFSGQSPTLTYEWLRCDAGGNACQTITGATGSTYVLTPGDVGDAIRVTVHATDGGGQTTATSQPTAQVQDSPPAAGAAAIEPHKPVIGSAAKATITGFGGTGVTLAYLWQRCSPLGLSCTAIAEATSPTYVPEDADLGRTLRVFVTATNEVGTTYAVSPPSEIVEARSPSATSAGSGSGNGSGSGGGTGSGSGAGSGSGGGSAGGAGQGAGANGSNATRDARLSFSQREGSKQSVKYGRRINIIGRLLTPAGRPIGGASVDILARVKRRGERTRRVAVARTDGRGYFKYVTPRGPSRTFDAGYRAVIDATQAGTDATLDYDARQRVDLDVAAGVRIAVSPRSARNLQTLTFRGRLLGGPFPKRGKPVVLQAQIRRRGRLFWQTFLTVAADKRGDLVGRYRLTRTYRPTIYRFRAVVPRGDDYPYGRGASRVVKVRVR